MNQKALEDAKRLEEAKAQAAEVERQRAEERAKAAAIQAEIDKQEGER